MFAIPRITFSDGSNQTHFRLEKLSVDGAEFWMGAAETACWGMANAWFRK